MWKQLANAPADAHVDHLQSVLVLAAPSLSAFTLSAFCDCVVWEQQVSFVTLSVCEVMVTIGLKLQVQELLPHLVFLEDLQLWRCLPLPAMSSPTSCSMHALPAWVVAGLQSCS